MFFLKKMKTKNEKPRMKAENEELRIIKGNGTLLSIFREVEDV